jgi:hypothetical protein
MRRRAPNESDSAGRRRSRPMVESGDCDDPIRTGTRRDVEQHHRIESARNGEDDPAPGPKRGRHGGKGIVGACDHVQR